ncbi:MAG: polynucleotide kinase-phosphatase [Candidatus Eremiobacteraeota bacterium]|nr:polynucleotide kinase-phosphatase [Candidatus Eremiobacteraeota bacterium]MCW5872183.1 polynucleotide kinase-phosphatase [Candidatus Eremiobacteraeota bacterium]
MKIEVPEFSLVLLMGASGSGKSSFARRHFLPTETISSDFCRGLVSDDENDQSCSEHAFEILHTIVAKRLQLGRLTVVDATHVQPEGRRPLLSLARKYHVLPCVIVFDLPEEVCHQRNASRPDRQFGPHVVRNHTRALRRSLRGLKAEGFRYVYRMHSTEEVEQATVGRLKVWNDKREETGPFDIIGDIHGCLPELEALLERLGTERKLIFLGDLVDRGPDSPGVLRRVMELVGAGRALCLPGNHDMKLLRHLNGKRVQLTHGLAETVEQLQAEPAEFLEQVKKFLDGLVSHYQLDGGRLIVAHAGLKAEMQGRTSGAVREFCLYGETTGETDEFGLPVRWNWAAEYRGRATVVYGHTPVLEPEWLNKTINIDTGCVFGGKLTALRYPEMEMVQVEAARTYAQPVRPLQSSAPGVETDGLDLADFLGRRTLATRYLRRMTIQEDFSIAALESLSRFAVDPRWLIYLPPTMSPPETSQQEGYLEHPLEALQSYQGKVICQEKHMGSRAVVVVCRHPEAAARHFWDVAGIGCIYTRTGRPFFDDAEMEMGLLQRLQAALEVSGLWDELGTSWMCLDCELMPWNLKAQALLKDQYAAVGSAALAHLQAALEVVPESLRGRYQQKLDDAYRYRQAYQRYCWDTPTLEQIRLAPFHLLASEGQVHSGRPHRWHLQQFERLGRQDPIFAPTGWLEFSLEEDPAPVVEWWLSLTASGGEGMVIKPEHWLARDEHGLVQPAVKCRGKEYLRIIYGPDYDQPDQLLRLRKRGLGRKRSLALREFALGLEGLERFVAHESLARVHECAFGVLALESEPVDPRL